VGRGNIIRIAVAAIAAIFMPVILAGASGGNHIGSAIGAGVLLVILCVFYFLPTLIAGRRGIPNAGSVAVVNIFLGWTCLGWIVALAMAAAGDTRSTQHRVPYPSGPPTNATKKCPDCAETVLSDARVCKHCGYRFAPRAPNAPQELAPRGKSTKVKCHQCQHVQVVPLGKSTFACEICNAKLKRRTT
jgi:ribosomal protein S27E